MPKQEVITLVSLAIESVQNDNLERGLRAADEAIQLDATYAEAHSARGVILAAKGESRAALASFKSAHKLARTAPRYSYNLAAQQYVLKDFRAAYNAAREALKDDPKFEKAIRLQEWIDAQDYDQTVTFDIPKVTRVVDEKPVPGPGHALPFMVGMEQPWRIAGWAFVAIGVLAAIMNIVFQPIMPPAENAKDQVMFNLAQTPGAMAAVFLMTISGVLTLMWMMIDIVDRKARLIWMIPAVVLCTCGMHALPQALYMGMRKD